MQNKVDIIGVPMDLGTGRRGVDMGPSAVRIAGLAEQIRALGLRVLDHGDVKVPIPEVPQPVPASTRVRRILLGYAGSWSQTLVT